MPEALEEVQVGVFSLKRRTVWPSGVSSVALPVFSYVSAIVLQACRHTLKTHP